VKRDVVVAVRLTRAEAQLIDERRGPLTRSVWLRMMLLDYEKTLPKPR
jgi:hypothetical protein